VIFLRGLLAFWLLINLGCQNTDPHPNQLVVAAPTKNVATAPLVDAEHTQNADREKTLAKLKAQQAASSAQWSKPLSEDYKAYSFEVGALASKIWFFSDGRYCMREIDQVRGEWSTQEGILKLSTPRGEYWIFQPLPSGIYVCKNSAETYLVPVDK